MAAFGRQCRRCPLCFKSSGSLKLSVFLFVFVFILMFLHFKLLPTVSGAYNQECHLTDEQLKNLRHAVKTIAKVMDKYNVSYWLDYGTLLGAVKIGDIIPWDHDGDISFILGSDSVDFHRELAVHGINSNGLQARYKGLSIDYMRWVPRNGIYDGKEIVMLHKYYPKHVLKNENAVVLYHHKLESFPLSWAVPPTKIEFQNARVSIPNSPQLLLAHRYPYSYWLNVNLPYKWKCWIPCFLRNSQWCDRQKQKSRR